MYLNRPVTAIFLVVYTGIVTTVNMPMMIHSDTKRFQGDGETPGCVLLITASNINGKYISAVIGLLKNMSRC